MPIMSRAIAARMLKARLDDYGLGVGLTGVGPAAQFSHGGSNEGFRCQFVAFKDRASGVVVMTNSDRGGAIMQEIIRGVAREYSWPGLAPIERTLGTSDPATYRDFAGRYEIPTRSPPVVLTIEADGGKLFGRSGSTRFELLPEAASIFFATENDARIEFVRGASGKVTEARVWQGTLEHKAVRQQ